MDQALVYLVQNLVVAKQLSNRDSSPVGETSKGLPVIVHCPRGRKTLEAPRQ
jgi:hypothetical protein